MRHLLIRRPEDPRKSWYDCIHDGDGVARGLLITGNAVVDAAGRVEPSNVVVTDERHLEGLRRWADAAQGHGTPVWVQLNHGGRQSPRRMTRQPVAPSELAIRGFAGAFARPRALTSSEIVRLIEQFATAAAVVQQAGFAGVQIHAAHGYLISQFLSPRTNLRDDEWGGDALRRRRFLLEIVKATRAAVHGSFAVGVKLNSADFQRGGFTIEESMEVAQALEAAGIDLLEISGGNYESPAMAGRGELRATMSNRSSEREAYFLDYARRIRSVTKLPLMLTGGMRTIETMAAAVDSGAIDVVGIARPMSYEPDLPKRLLSGDSAAATPIRIRSRIRKVDDALQIFWFQAQIHRMARGHEPDPALGRWTALWRGARGSFLPTCNRSRAALPADTPQ